MAYNLGHVVGPAGKGIQGISKTDTTGLVDTYTITYSDGTTSTFTVTNGESNADVVTEWENTPSDSKVPSEKLTKDSLDDKADSDHTHTGMLTTSDVKDNLTSTDTNKPLSANQGKQLKTLVDGKQATLVSGTNIKTINNNSLLGSGNIDIQGGGADVGTFTELQALITSASSGDIIVLDKDYKNTGSESEIEIDKPLTIMGNGHVIDADEKSRIFKIDTSSNTPCAIIGIIFMNGYAGNGAGIWTTSKINIFNCIFNYNTGTTGDGGAVYGGIMSVSDCIFNYNSTEEDGGAIRCTRSSSVTNCRFNNNSSSSNGGAIRCGASASVSDCNFNNNTASNANNVYNSDENLLTIYNCHVSTGLYNTVNYDDINSENLVTSWSSTVTDTHIASEKLIKDTIDGLSIPTKISDLTNDSDFIETSSTSGLIKNDGTVMTSGTGSTNYSAGNHTHSGYVSATKVTSWSSTTSDSNVPSEKLVKDSLDSIEDLIGDAIQYINQ